MSVFASAHLHRGVPETLGVLLRRTAERFGPRLAVTDTAGRDRTYQQLIDRGARLANALRGLGIRPGDRVAAMLEDRTESVEVYVGAALAGCVLVHVNARNTAAELEHVLGNSSATALVHTEGVTAAVEGLGSTPDLAAIIGIGGVGRGVAYERLLAEASPRPPAETREPEDIAILAYTSGTTGRPKAAMVSHRAVVNCARVSPYYYGLPPGSRTAYSASMSFVGTVWAQILPTLWLGGTVDLLGRLDAEAWVARIAKTGAAFTYVSSPRVAEFTEQVVLHPDVLASLRVVMHSGSAAPRQQLAALRDAVGPRLRETYGTTEIVGCVSSTLPHDYSEDCPADDLLASVGCPLPSANALILDEDGAPLGPGQQGNVLVDSDSMFSGYWGDPAKTKSAFRDGWFRTEDLGYRDEAGFLYIVGRTAELIVSGGANVWPTEVERVIQGLPGVKQVAVFGLPHDRWGETVAAAVVPQPGHIVTEESVITHARRELAGYKKPTRVFLVSDLPVNASQKLDRLALRAQFEAGEN
jgi:acyl-coenzyme A synthetase/AMP-(fatty) acid ligase